MTMNRVIVVAFGGLLVLSACGGGGSSGPGGSARPTVLPPLPPQGIQHARQAPIVDLDGTLHIGSDVAASASVLHEGLRHRGISTSFGYVTDGIGRQELVAYLEDDAGVSEYNPDGNLLSFGSRPPTVRFAPSTTAAQRDEAVRAVQLINANLPREWQLPVSSDPGPAEVRDGEILISFLPFAEWPSDVQDDGRAGQASRSGFVSTGEITSTHVLVDPIRASGTYRLNALVHELLHALGRNHADPVRFPDTLMLTRADLRDAHILYPLDREALLAVYGWLDPGDTPANIAEDLGPWASTSYHIRGDIEAVDGAAFGVAYRNDLSKPWASGPTPWTNLADNSALSGTASWEGAMIGFDRYTGSHVGSDADLEIDLGSLAGALDFTSMEAWATGDVVAIGTGTMWGDGDLAYTVGVRGNTFIQTGGDDGLVTGAFFGAQHEGMGGTLLRDDLKAAFGGSR